MISDWNDWNDHDEDLLEGIGEQMIFYVTNKVTGDLNILSFQSFEELKELVERYGEVRIIDPGDSKKFLQVVIEVEEKEQ